MNQVRVRDVIAANENTFEVHKLEHVEDKTRSDTNSGIVMRLECESEDKKNEWVKAINSEVKQLRSMARYFSEQVFSFSTQ